MKIGLAAYKFRNNDIEFNISQIEKAILKVRNNVQLLCFGESFLQGFDSLAWNYEKDKDIAITKDSEVMKRLCNLSFKYKMDLLFGYFELDNELIYSSCVLIEKGKIIHNYRRISKNWKEYNITDYHYCEGCSADEFKYRNRRFKIALCGDLWIFPELFKSDDLLIWPIYTNFELSEWKNYEQEYANQALLACSKTLVINSLSDNPISHGNAFYFLEGNIKSKLNYDEEDILLIEV